MSIKNAGEQFIHQKDSKLHISKEVEHEQKRKILAGEDTTQKPAAKLKAWFKVLEKTHGHEEPGVRERIRNYYHKKHVIKPEDIPESYFDNQKRLARELGHGDIEITEEVRDAAAENIIADQKSTLDAWLDYLTARDSDSFPMWAKYWAFTNMVKLSSYDKEKHAFGKRDKGTVAPFPDLNRESLAYVVDAIIKKANKEQIENQDPEFKKLLEGVNFGKLYAWAIEKVTPTEENELINTKGEWVKYKEGSDHMPLVKSLQGHGTGWCTAGESTARAQLDGGDFYVYYSYDKEGKPTIPRVAIRMQKGKIAEVRGIAKNQNMDPYITEVTKKKLTEFPDGKEYEKKTEDMKRLTQVENKVKLGQDLSKDDLIFLYEIDSAIEGFGYKRDPRIQELVSQRDSKKDAAIVFDCQPDQIAHSKDEIGDDTKVYIGELYPEIFDELPKDIEHIYTSFPEGKIVLKEITIGGKNANELTKELKEKGFEISDYTEKEMMGNKDFKPLKKVEKFVLVIFLPKDFGLDWAGATTQEIYEKAQEFGLKLVPAEVGPQLRLQYQGQPRNDCVLVGSDPLADSSGDPSVFGVDHVGDAFRLVNYLCTPNFNWPGDYRWVFARK